MSNKIIYRMRLSKSKERFRKTKKSQNQFKNGLMHIERIRVKKGQRTDLSQTKKNAKNS